MSFVNFLKNYWATIWFIVLMYLFYQYIPYYVWFFDKTFVISRRNMSFHADSIFQIIIVGYMFFLIPYYITYTEHSTFRKIIAYLRSYIKWAPHIWSNTIQQLFLKCWVKFFFAPLMIFWLTDHIVTLINNIYIISENTNLMMSDFSSFFISHLFRNLFSLILFLDVFFFTIWYMTERDKLDNTIKSVQPYAIWWIVALMCYPPFNNLTTGVLQRYSTDFPQFANPRVTVIVGIIICILMGVYTRASISLWWKASNLTNRGIVTTGPYKYIRHPAYVSKNMAWTFGTLPLIIGALSTNDFRSFVFILLSLLWRWSIYYARAITEEMHLSEDPDYQTYMQKVKYRYIPGIF